jgi:hypothetical protein
MNGPDAQYRCESCEQISLQKDLVFDSWGDPCCSACKSPRIVRHHSKGEQLYAWFFTFRVF